MSQSQVSTDFKNALKEFINMKQNIKGGQQQIREWKRRKEILEKQIMQFMEKNDLTKKEINTPVMSIKYHVAKRKSGCTQKHIKHRLLTYYNGDETKVNEIWKFVQEGRSITEHPSLRTLEPVYSEGETDEED